MTSGAHLHSASACFSRLTLKASLRSFLRFRGSLARVISIIVVSDSGIKCTMLFQPDAFHGPCQGFVMNAKSAKAPHTLNAPEAQEEALSLV